jgi:hypothetical protein
MSPTSSSTLGGSPGSVACAKRCSSSVSSWLVSMLHSSTTTRRALSSANVCADMVRSGAAGPVTGSWQSLWVVFAGLSPRRSAAVAVVAVTSTGTPALTKLSTRTDVIQLFPQPGAPCRAMTLGAALMLPGPAEAVAAAVCNAAFTVSMARCCAAPN